MANQIVYYQDPNGRTFKKTVVLDDAGQPMSYPDAYILVVDEGGATLELRSGYVALNDATGEANLAAQAIADQATQAAQIAARVAAVDARVAAIQAAYLAGEFGTMTPATVLLITGVAVI